MKKAGLPVMDCRPWQSP